MTHAFQPLTISTTYMRQANGHHRWVLQSNPFSKVLVKTLDFKEECVFQP